MSDDEQPEERPAWWWSVGRVIGHIEPIVWLPHVSYYDALSWAVAELQIPPGELVVAPVWVGYLPKMGTGQPRKLRVDYEAKRLAKVAGSPAEPTGPANKPPIGQRESRRWGRTRS